MILLNEDIIQEVSAYAPKKLREMEKTFAILRKSANHKKARIQLIAQIKNFTRISNVVLFFTDEYNAGVIPVYKKSTFKSIVQTAIQMVSEEPAGEKIPRNKLKNLESVAESSDMIDTMYLFLGKPLIQTLKPAEMVAVILHELGHAYAASSSVPDDVLNFIKPFLIIVPWSTSIVGSILGIMSHLLMLFSLSVFVLRHGITFTQRMGEYSADNFAVKYGYGDELIFAMNKFSGKETNIKKTNEGLITNIFQDLVNFLIHVIVPSTYTYPSQERRIKNIEDRIFNHYKRIYPNYQFCPRLWD